MKLFRYRGKRIRPADRDLVFRSACCVVLPVFLAAFALLNLKTILQTDWRRLFMLGVGGFGWHMPYLLLSSIVSAAVAGTVLVLLYRLFPDVVRQLMHRQKLARMVLENQWYEQAERTKQDGFFKDLPSPDTKTKIARFPRMYYRMENGLLHFQVEITMGKYQEPLLHLETKLESGLYCELVSRELRDGYVEYTLLYDMVANRIPIAEAKAEGGRLRLMKNVWWEYDTLPHMLIAGGTGGGKTYFILTIIQALLQTDAVLHILDPKNADLADLSTVMPDVIWQKFFLKDFDIPTEKLAGLGEELCYMFDRYRKHIVKREGLKETLEALRQRGYRLGVISNIMSTTFVPRILEEHGIAQYFETITMSSVCGIRKPRPEIFEIALNEMRIGKEQAAYVGDTISRDVRGVRNAGWPLMIQIDNPRIYHKDEKYRGMGYEPDVKIGSLPEVVTAVEQYNRNLKEGQN